VDPPGPNFKAAELAAFLFARSASVSSTDHGGGRATALLVFLFGEFLIELL
jgi:hypothetical protein